MRGTALLIAVALAGCDWTVETVVPSDTSPAPPAMAQALRSNVLAYVRVGGQVCQYNEWSRLGRAYLETLLAKVRVIGRMQR